MIVITSGTEGIKLTLKQLETIHIKAGQRVKIEKWIPPITDDQRGMLFSYYRFCINHGLKELGHFSVDGVHEDVKAWCNEFHPGDFGGQVSIKRMDKTTFDIFWKLIDLEYFQQLAGIDTSLFWIDYENWKNSGTELTFREWKDSYRIIK